jgi:signal transduction histidine kinase
VFHFLVARGDDIGSDLWLIEVPGSANLRTVHEELGRLNSELVNTQRELFKERSRLKHALEREEEALAAAQTAVRARDETLRVVAHDLRNPLSTVLAIAGLLTDVDLEPAERRAQLRLIERVIQQMNRLVGDLLDVARIEAGRVSLVRERIPPSELAVEAARLFDQQAKARSITLRSDVPESVPDVSGDRDRVLQIFSNLIANALDVLENGGRIVIGAHTDGNLVRFTVSDDGPGIPTDQQDDLFRPFWQGAAKSTGAGLGLAICRGLVEAHGGEIGVESSPETGTTFFFTIPAHAGP